MTTCSSPRGMRALLVAAFLSGLAAVACDDEPDTRPIDSGAEDEPREDAQDLDTTEDASDTGPDVTNDVADTDAEETVRIDDMPRPGAPIEVIVDSEEIPHLYAQTDLDLFWGAGYLQASTLLFDIDIAVRAARGRLSEVFGDAGVSGDIQAHTIGFEELAERSLELLDGDRDTILLTTLAEAMDTWIDRGEPSFEAIHLSRFQSADRTSYEIPTDGADTAPNVAQCVFFDGDANLAETCVASAGAVFRSVVHFDEDGTPRMVYNFPGGSERQLDDWVESTPRPARFRRSEIEANEASRFLVGE